jgi:hypothetical protein
LTNLSSPVLKVDVVCQYHLKSVGRIYHHLLTISAGSVDAILSVSNYLNLLSSLFVKNRSSFVWLIGK